MGGSAQATAVCDTYVHDHESVYVHVHTQAVKNVHIYLCTQIHVHSVLECDELSKDINFYLYVNTFTNVHMCT